ncbi:YjbD family (DUF3811) [Providencia rustigianii]|uniref:YjbD family (DUF3811) n=2 Tax=Providencia rustigianii TaxID=158850 RepID=D1NYR9_9GAMM|nr:MULTISPECIES: DUF3811 domain-containing protein [Providencia]EFB73617.1 hypothetical protein PROVRUST_04889 [Providencia rustigianii DSM 4541]MTC57512.1 DUF3811 domain-containing protein [Providencia rustigianii]MTC61083.1 DUF3811 domain-containing protein [Providencia rustigianii]SPY77604.1 YjbD family (DUF3811) [Providencia rustigianii]SUC27058.1 YjbD family (DUF3811) [Providencia rustigianii]
MKILTLQEMTESQRMRVRQRLAQERKSLGRELSNSEENKVKKQIITEISAEVEKEAKKLRVQKKKDRVVDTSSTFSWSSNNHTRGHR